MKNILYITVLLLATTSWSTAQSQNRPASKARKKIVLIAGPDSHGKGEHEHHGGCTLLADALNNNVAGVAAVVVRNGWPKDMSVLSDADAIVLYADGGGDNLAIPHLVELDKLLAKGVGLVTFHFALEVPKGDAGDHFLKWIGGYFETDWSVNPVWEASFTTYPDHPIARGVKPFSITDEWYFHLRFTRDQKNLTPILQSLPPESTLNRPEGTHSNNAAVREAVLKKREPQTLAWAYNRPGGGRGFGSTGGHIHKNWGDDNFRKVVLNAMVWAAGAEVPADGVSSKTPTESELDALTKEAK